MLFRSYTGNVAGIRIGEPEAGNATPINVVLSGMIDVSGNTSGTNFLNVLSHVAQVIDATAATFVGTTDPFAIEDLVDHAMDDASLGLVVWNPNNVYVTPNSGSIQRGVDAVSDSWTVNVAPGAYSTGVKIGKPLSLHGEPGATIELGSMDWISIAANDVTVEGFTITGRPFYFALEAGMSYFGAGAYKNIRIANNHFLAGIVPIWFENVSDSVIEGNTFARSGPDLWWADNVTIRDNDISHAASSGMWVYFSKDVHISGNQIVGGSHPDGTGDTGIHSQNNEDLQIIENIISGFLAGEGTSYNHGVAGAGINEYSGYGTSVLRNVLSGNSVGVRVLDSGGSAATMVIHYNSIIGNTDYGVFVYGGLPTGSDWKYWDYDQYGPATQDVNAALNWWGDADGPSGEGTGSGDAVSTNVIFSPWLGTNPDGNSTLVGVQITDPMTIIVAPVGPPPAGGYLNAAITGSNELPAEDTIEVRHGTYDASVPIEDGVTMVSEVGSAAHTELTGPITIAASDVLLGRLGQGFTIRGPITVGAGKDASTVHINWNDIFDFVINGGDNTLDATFNFWGEDGPDTLGLVAINPILPESSDVIVSYMSDFDLNALQAIDFSYLLDELNKEKRALVTLDLMATFFFSMDEALELIDEYGWSHIRNALRWCDGDYDQFVTLLVGYAVGGHRGAGGGGALAGEIEIYPAGGGVPLVLELLNPITGEVVDDAMVSYSVCRTLPDGTVAIVAFGVMTYDGDLGAFTFDVDTTGYEPGVYDVYLGTDDGRSQHFQIEVTAD